MRRSQRVRRFFFTRTELAAIGIAGEERLVGSHEYQLFRMICGLLAKRILHN